MSIHLPIATPKHLRRRALALLGVAVTLGAGAAALPVADAEAQTYTTYQNYDVVAKPDYQVTKATTRWGRVYLTITNTGRGSTSTSSWAAVRNYYGDVLVWMSVPGLAAGQSWGTSVAAPDGVHVCADNWANYIAEANEHNNCRQVEAYVG